MKQIVTSDFKLGIIAGGQLGKMLIQPAISWDVQTYVLDPSPDCPCAAICNTFIQGDIKDYDTVLAFGKQVDMITLEIEHVNVDALRELKKMGKTVHPDPEALAIIQDKGLQKEFYAKHNLPTSPFKLYENEKEIKDAVESGELSIPFVQKSRTAGYDGKGVKVVLNQDDLAELLPGKAMVEAAVDIEKEIAVIASRNEKGDILCFPSVEMEFNPTANLVERLICPAAISEEMEQKAQQLAQDVIKHFDICGILAIEMFISKSGELLVNEVAPRPHNSGHHTIEANITSQYEQHLRAIFNLPLGSTELLNPAVMINVLGEAGHTGKVKYEGLAEAMAVKGMKMHLYGKTECRPFRKMGHVTVVSPSLEEAREGASKVQQHLKAKAW